MSRILKVSDSNYRLQVLGGGNITLDVGSITSGGTVVITGNLDVKGVTTQIESVTTTVNDNLLQLNWTNGGSNGNGIPVSFNYIAGIEIERGAYSAARFVYNEQVGFNDTTNGGGAVATSGGFQTTTANSTIQGIQVAKIAANGVTNGVGAHTNDLIFDLQGTTSALRVSNYSTSGSNNYVNNATLPDHIPTVGWVNFAIANNYTPGSGTPGQAVVSKILYPVTGTETASITATGSTLTFFVGTATLATAVPLGLTLTGYAKLDNVLIGGAASTITNTANTITTVSNVNSNTSNLVLTASNSNVEIAGVLNLDDQTWNTPTFSAGLTKMYSSSTVGPGNTGVYVTNNTAQTPDELISRNRAVLLSILL
jgi:hypothetical protein